MDEITDMANQQDAEEVTHQDDTSVKRRNRKDQSNYLFNGGGGESLHRTLHTSIKKR